ncbi:MULTISPECIES: amino acid ABC transporter permease [unclassified Rhizobium]|uniref:amino acid ABC transporter permease n=1 Tax=unclassified Rhizobium TaxID=2613769 RepID=UPI001ADADDB4|nr:MULTISPECIES: amino acid ABC transporter permease [unclassified Rhizobium]MBO9123725.1 amino acid ABC transporter permease [Rhizobium sp. 16-488-2b]MBO9174257.1 amino acid ABC transporter permease [Rhizobium sp. 16-488-2a]
MDFDFSAVLDSWQYLAGGLGLTLLLSALTVILSLICGVAVALGRMYGPKWLSMPLVFYIDSMRAIPVLVVLVWIYFALPLLTNINLPPFWAALVALTFHISAFVAEIVRAGIGSVRAGQTQAGLVLGMSEAQVMRKIILPQALIRMLPSIGSIISITIKDTAIAAVIAVPELMKRTETVSGQSFRPMEAFTVAMVVYFLILFPATRLIDLFYKNIGYRGRS